MFWVCGCVYALSYVQWYETRLHGQGQQEHCNGLVVFSVNACACVCLLQPLQHSCLCNMHGLMDVSMHVLDPLEAGHMLHKSHKPYQ